MPRNKKIVKPVIKNEKIVEPVKKPRSFFRNPSIVLFVVVLFFVLGSLVYKNKGLFMAGTVNNKPITSFELYKKLVGQYGKQMVDQIVVEKLIREEAGKRKVTISNSDIDQEIKRVEESLGKTVSLNDALAQQGMTLNDFKKQIELRLLANKLVEDKVKVTDEEVDNYIKNNKDTLNKDEDANKQKESVKSYLKDQKANEEIQKLIKDLKSKAKINLYL